MRRDDEEGEIEPIDWDIFHMGIIVLIWSLILIVCLIQQGGCNAIPDDSSGAPVSSLKNSTRGTGVNWVGTLEGNGPPLLCRSVLESSENLYLSEPSIAQANKWRICFPLDKRPKYRVLL